MADNEDGSAQASADDGTDVLPNIPIVTAEEKELGSKAQGEFDRKQFDSCIKLLDRLLATRLSDPKVLHNKTVTEYFASGLRTTDEFLQQLSKVSVDNVDSLDDVDQCVIYYNQTVVNYHLRRYGDALAAAEKLYTFLEPLDESLSKRVMCILAELYLCTSQPERAIAIVNSLEKAVFKQKEGEPPAEETSRTNPASPTPAEGVNDVWKMHITLYKVQCLILSRSMKHCKREMKNLAGLSNDACSAYMKANYEYLRGNLQKSMRVLNSVQPANSPKRLTDITAAMYYNNLACIHMMMKKHNLGAFYFRKALQENEQLAKELKLETLGHTVSGKPLYSLPMSRHFELLFNTGIQLLHCGKPLAAFDCLIEAIKVYSSNPRLWLRLAECCIMANRKHNDDDRSLEKRLQVIEGVVGSGIHRKLILGNGKGDFRPCTESAAMPVATLEFSALCLANALHLLSQAETIANNRLSEELGSESASTQDRILIPAPPGPPMKMDEVTQLRSSILANSAYVSLLLNDHTMAMQYAERLSMQENLSPAHRYLAKMYMAEAQVYLDKIGDAIRNLNYESITDISLSSPDDRSTSEQDREQNETSEYQGNLFPWIPADVPKARAFMLYNLAVCYAMREDFDKAMAHLALCTQTIGTPLPVHVYFLRLYLDLIEGRRKIAQGIIKEHFGHVTPNRV